ncbi:MAG TPA: hypothetical protein VFL17_21670 [Anaerolineae bacterium]|nr:hypothetical protein [Anaerolineae bacterium]
MNKKVILSLILSLALVPINSVRGQEGKPPSRAVVLVEGKEIPAIEGDVIVRGNRTIEGRCQFPAYTVEIEGNSSRYDRVVLTATEDCRLVVSEVTSQLSNESVPASPPDGGETQAPTSGNDLTGSLEMNAMAANRRFGWARMTFYEQFGIAVTLSHAEMSYWDDGSSVWGGQQENSYCWWRSSTGWFLIECTSDSSFGGPSAVWHWVRGTYNHSVFSIWHRTTATFNARPGGNWTKACSFEGTMPPFWYTRCEADSWIL